MFSARVRAMVCSAVLACGLGIGAQGAVYTDVTGEKFPSDAPHLDISSVEVTNDATNLVFKINLVGDIQATNWGKYLIGIDSVAGGSNTSNGWGRPISMPGMDYWVGSWVDTTPAGGELYRFNGTTSAWDRITASYDAATGRPVPALTSNSTTITIPLADLGLGIGSTFTFDVFSSAGDGTSANDALGNSAQTISDWSNPYNSGTNVRTFNVVPEPGTLGVLGLAGLALLARRRK